MCPHCWNKLTAAGSALVVAGILTSAAVVLDVFMPKGSLIGLLMTVVLLGFFVTGALIGFGWVCGKCESYFQGPWDGLLDGSRPSRNDSLNLEAAMGPQPMEPTATGDARPMLMRRGLVSAARQTTTLRGSVSAKDATRATRARRWHGQ
jgi:hypothetical protein